MLNQVCWHTGLLKTVLQPVENVWMTDRFRIAACNRYRRLAAACDDQLPFSVSHFCYSLY